MMGPRETKRVTHTTEAQSPAQFLGGQDRKGSEKLRQPSGVAGVTERQRPRERLTSPREQERVTP